MSLVDLLLLFPKRFIHMNDQERKAVRSRGVWITPRAANATIPYWEDDHDSFGESVEADYCTHCGNISTQMHVLGEYIFCEQCWQQATVK